MDKYSKILLSLLLISIVLIATGAMSVMGWVGGFEHLEDPLCLSGGLLALTLPILGQYFNHRRDIELQNKVEDTFARFEKKNNKNGVCR